MRFNLEFDAYRNALPARRHPDMTDHAEYFADVVQVTIEQGMRKEAIYMHKLRVTHQRVEEVIEGPAADIDPMIRSVHDNYFNPEGLPAGRTILNTAPVSTG